jgi:hypothetical protein
MNLPCLRPSVDGARAQARQRGRLDRRDHLNLAIAARAPAAPCPKLPVNYQEPLGLDRNLDYFLHVGSLLMRCAFLNPQKLFLPVEGFGL